MLITISLMISELTTKLSKSKATHTRVVGELANHSIENNDKERDYEREYYEH